MGRRLAAEGLTSRSALGEAAAQWATSRWVEADGWKVRYREAGRGGTPLVLVHGLGVSADYWTRNGPAIAAEGFHVLAPDLPGFGRTKGPPEGLEVGQQAHAVLEWSRVMDLPPAVYVGHSLSCQSVLELAVAHPEAVSGLVLAAPTGEGESRRRLARQAIGFLRDIRRESVTLAALVLQAYLRAGPGKVMRTWRLGALHDPMPLLPEVSVPVLVVVGENDPVVDADFAERMVAELRNGRLVLIPKGSHAVIFDPSGRFNEAIIRFMRELPPFSPPPAE
jgi:2-hydroxy-6-oxonona-2,4-dienedioate hydrolase